VTCGNTPTLLVDWTPYVPDAGQGSVEIPDIAVNATSLFFLLYWNVPLGSGTSDRSDGYLMRTPIHGGKAVRMAFIPGGASQGSQALAVTPTAVIFSELSQGQEGDEAAGAIISVPADGGDATTLTATKGLANTLVADQENAYFVDTEATKSVSLAGGLARTLGAVVPASLGLVGRTLYLADSSGGTVSAVPIEGGPVTVVAKDQSAPSFPVACGTNLCWLNMDGGATLMQLAPAAAAPFVLADGLPASRDLVFDGRNFFVTSGGFGGVLFRIPSTGGTPVMAEAAENLTNIALDETCLYWAGLRGIWSLARSAADVAGTTQR
jgi:hypothetical protein